MFSVVSKRLSSVLESEQRDAKRNSVALPGEAGLLERCVPDGFA